MKLLDALSSFTEWTDHLLTRSTARAGWLRPLQLEAYRSYGTDKKFYIKGRLLADRGLAAQTARPRHQLPLAIARRIQFEDTNQVQIIKAGRRVEHW